MLGRCNNLKDQHYSTYGGRGIKVCKRWSGNDGFINFVEDMGEKPKGKSIDRIDNDGGYTPENCRWVTRQRQSNNMASNHLVTFNGRTQTLMDWSRETGIPHSTLWKRLKEGWTEEEALTIKPTVGTNGYNGERLRSRRADLESL